MTSAAESVLLFPERIAFFLLLLAVTAVAARTVFRRISLIRLGRSTAPSAAGKGGQLKRFVLYVPGQASNIRTISAQDLGGLQHLVLFWGFIFLGLYYALFLVVGDGLGASEVLRGHSLSRIFLPAAEMFALLLLIALGWGLVRRTVWKPARLGPDYEGTLFLVITLAAYALLSCFFTLEALRFTLGMTPQAGPVSGLIAGLFGTLAGGSETLAWMFHAAWWLQAALIACFIVYVPYSSHQHALFAPANIFTSHPQPKGRASRIEMNQSYRGLAGLNDFTWKQLLELYGCAQCGRCQEACPAKAAGKPISPKEIIGKLRVWMDETGEIRPFWKGGEAPGRGAAERITDEELWSCTTCMACVQACPAFVSALDKIIDLRRDRVLAKSRFFPEVTQLFRDLENFGDIFGKGRARREDWAVGRDIKVLSAKNRADTLFWVGCQASFNDRSRNSAVSLAEVLTQGGVDLAILGKGEFCCGDPLRRLGNEYQYQKFVRRNIEQLKKLRFRRIVTYCPHCYNTLKNEYSQFDGTFEVVHYTELLQDLIAGGKLPLRESMPAKVAYHDPCYLSRGNGLAKGREVIDRLPGVKSVEVERSGEQTFCCGGGGGAMWMRDTGGGKINDLRVEELAKDAPDVIATSCPYCVAMLESGIQSLGLDKVQCKDLIEIVRERL